MKKLVWCSFAALLGSVQAQAWTLSKVISIAGERDPTFQAQLARTNADQEAVAQVRSRLMPQVSFEASREYQDRALPNTGDNFVETGSSVGWYQSDENVLRVDQVLFDSVLAAEIREAAAGTKVALASLEEARLSLVDEVINDYIETLKQAETVALLDQEILSVRQALKLAWSRYLDGTARETDALRAEGRVLSVVNQRSGAAAEFQAQLDLLGQKIGVAPQFLRGLDPQSGILQAYDFDAELAELNSTALRIPRLQQEVRQASLNVQQRSYYPTIDLSYATERTDGTQRKVTSGGVNTRADVRRENTATITFSWDLYTGGNRTSRVREAEANVVAAEFDVEAAERQFRFDLAGAQRRARLLETTQKSLKVALDAFEKVAVEQRAAYQSGLIDIATVLQAESDLAAARAEFVIAKYDAILAQTELRRLSGGLDEAFFQEIDDLFSKKITVAEVLASR